MTCVHLSGGLLRCGGHDFGDSSGGGYCYDFRHFRNLFLRQTEVYGQYVVRHAVNCMVHIHMYYLREGLRGGLLRCGGHDFGDSRGGSDCNDFGVPMGIYSNYIYFAHKPSLP
jgi:hypothetical protein